MENSLLGVVISDGYSKFCILKSLEIIFSLCGYATSMTQLGSCVSICFKFLGTTYFFFLSPTMYLNIHISKSKL